MKYIILSAIICGILGVMLYLVAPVLTPFVLGIVLAYLLNPMVSRITELGVNRTIATWIPIGLFVLMAGTVLTIGLPALITELIDLAQEFPAYLAEMKKTFARSGVIGKQLKTLGIYSGKNLLTDQMTMLGTQLTGTLTQTIQGLVSSTMAVLSVLAYLGITPVVLFYVLRDWPAFVKKTFKFIPPSERDDVRRVMAEIDAAMSNLLRGQGSVCLLLGTFYGLGLWAVGLKLGFLIGMGTGLLSFIPYAGMAIGAVTAFAVALMQFGLDGVMTPYLLIGGVFTAGQILESFFLTPSLVGEKVGLHPVWVLLAVVAGGQLGGMLGVMIALPIATASTVLLPRAMKVWHESSVAYAEKRSARKAAKAKTTE